MRHVWSSSTFKLSVRMAKLLKNRFSASSYYVLPVEVDLSGLPALNKYGYELTRKVRRDGNRD